MKKIALVLLLVGCKTHVESSSSLQASESLSTESLKRIDTTEPVAVPQKMTFRGWTTGPLIVPSAGQFHLPSVAPLPPPDGGTYIEGEIDYGPPQQKVTHEENGQKTQGSLGVAAKAALEKDSKPSGIFSFLAGNWFWLLLAAPALLIAFRKSGPVQAVLKLLPFRIPFISP